jgi:hydroxymethylpyrimidine/phosphomethylpyrimidine kinase
MAALEAAGKQLSVVRDDLAPTLQVLAGNHDEVSVLSKQSAKTEVSISR